MWWGLYSRNSNERKEWMMTVLKITAGHAFQMQSRILKPCTRLSNNGTCLPYAVLHLVLVSEKWALTVPFATFFIYYRTKSRLTNPWVQMPLMHAIISQTSCCNLWMTVNPMMATYGSQTKRIFTWMAHQQAKLGNFGEAKILILLKLYPCIHQK